MNNLTTQDSYKLEVANFGPIIEADIELRPLTVFVGPSNTGKSYLATLIYALHQCFGRITVGPPGLFPQRLRHWFMGRPQVEAFIRDSSAWQSLRDWVTGISEGLRTTGQARRAVSSIDWITKEPLPPLPPDLTPHLYPVLEDATSFNQLIENQLCRCFGASAVDELIRRVNPAGKHGDTRIGVTCPNQESVETPARFYFCLSKDSSNVKGGIEDTGSLSLELDHDLRLPRWIIDTGDHLFKDSDAYNSQDGMVLEYLTDLLFRSWFRPLNRIAYYLPADRTGIMHSHQVVVSTLVQNAATAGRRAHGNGPVLSGVLADFLDQLIEMSNPKTGHHPNSLKQSAASIENAMLKGAVRLQDVETGYPVFSYRPRKWKTDLPLMRVSSMVAELAPVVLYLRYVVVSGNVLIIEEPEAHLHPAMQVEFIRQLALLVRAGVKVIVTTHSEWILEELANIVRRSEIPDSTRKEIPKREFALKPGQVGAWLFEPQRRKAGSVVKEIPLDVSGLYPAKFDDVACMLHNDWADISGMVGNNE